LYCHSSSPPLYLELYLKLRKFSLFTKLPFKEKPMDQVNPYQRILLSAEYLFDVKSFSEFETLFSYLPSTFKEHQNTGRPKTPFLSSLKCLIYMSISGVKNLSELRRILLNNPSPCLKCRFDPLHLPPVERFSLFLKDTPNAFFKRIETQLVKKLVDCEIVSGRYLTIDTSSVPIQCKENNLKTSLRDRFDKMHPPKLDPQAGLGVMIKYIRPFEKKVTYFWGYKNHILSDATSGLPLFELTKPANVSEGKLLISIIKKLKKLQGLVPGIILSSPR
jgi:hypothetical protein